MKLIFHELDARVIHLLTTDRQSVIYPTANHLLARLYFDSITQETAKKQVYSSDIASFSPLHEKKSRQNL